MRNGADSLEDSLQVSSSTYEVSSPSNGSFRRRLSFLRSSVPSTGRLRCPLKAAARTSLLPGQAGSVEFRSIHYGDEEAALLTSPHPACKATIRCPRRYGGPPAANTRRRNLDAHRAFDDTAMFQVDHVRDYARSKPEGRWGTTSNTRNGEHSNFAALGRSNSVCYLRRNVSDHITDGIRVLESTYTNERSSEAVQESKELYGRCPLCNATPASVPKPPKVTAKDHVRATAPEDRDRLRHSCGAGVATGKTGNIVGSTCYRYTGAVSLNVPERPIEDTKVTNPHDAQGSGSGSFETVRDLYVRPTANDECRSLSPLHADDSDSDTSDEISYGVCSFQPASGDISEGMQRRKRKVPLSQLLRRVLRSNHKGEECAIGDSTSLKAFTYQRDMMRESSFHKGNEWPRTSKTALASNDQRNGFIQTLQDNACTYTGATSGSATLDESVNKQKTNPAGGTLQPSSNPCTNSGTRLNNTTSLGLACISSGTFEVNPETAEPFQQASTTVSNSRDKLEPFKPETADVQLSPNVDQRHPRVRAIVNYKFIFCVIALLVSIAFLLCIHLVDIPEDSTSISKTKLEIRVHNGTPETSGNKTMESLQRHKEGYELCTAALCRRDGFYLKALFSWNTDPCDNFYRFVCGRWKSTVAAHKHGNDTSVAAHEDSIHILEERMKVIIRRTNSLEELFPLRDVFNECMDTKKLEDENWNPMLELLWQVALDGFPFSSTTRNQTSLWTVSAVTLRMTGVETLFSVRKMKDSSGKEEMLLLGPPAVLSSNAGNREATLRFYSSSAYAAFTALKKNANPWDCSQEVAGFASELEGLAYNNTVLTASHSHRIDTLMHHPHLHSFLRGIFTGSPSADSVGHNSKFAIESSEFVNGLLSLVRRTERHIALNYVGVRLMVEMSAFVPSSGLQLTHSLIHSMYKRKRAWLPRWKLCLRVAEKAIPMLFLHASRLVHQSHFIIDSVQHHIAAMSEGLASSLDKVAVFDKLSMLQAKKILNQSRIAIFYPRWIENKESILKLVSAVPKVSRGQGLLSFYTLRGHHFRESLHEDPEDQWVGSAFDTDCRYNGYTVYVPALLYNFSLVNVAGDETFQLPHAGVRIMRCVLEMILHGVFSENATDLLPWWPDLTGSFLGGYKTCLREYGIKPREALQVLAGTAAIKPVFEAYKAEKGADIRFENFQTYSSDRLFFVYYAVGFCSGNSTGTNIAGSDDVEYLTNLPLWNSRSFQETFRCPVGSRMNPRSKCVIWHE